MSNVLFILISASLVLLIWIKKPNLPIKKNVIVAFSQNPRQWLKYAWIVTILAVLFMAMNVFELMTRLK